MISIAGINCIDRLAMKSSRLLTIKLTEIEDIYAQKQLIAKALAEVAKNGDRGFREVEKLFSLTSAVENYCQLYKSINLGAAIDSRG